MLSVLEKIFRRLKDEKIEYLHWKSNEHLEAALNGDTDLDIMVRPEHHKRFVHILEEEGFSLYQATGKQKYISIFDYVKLDSESKKVLHVHLHDRFMIGRKFYKEYLIPIDNAIFENAIEDDRFPIKVMHPAQELIILWIRYCLKTGPIKLLLKRFGISSDFKRESQWLEERVNIDDLELYAKDLLLDKDDTLLRCLKDFLKSGRSGKKMMPIIHQVRKNYKPYKTEKMTGIKYLFIRAGMVWNYILQNKVGLPTPYRRINPAGGRIIAIIGADGAGKSTVTNMLQKSLLKKIDVYYEYLGSGDGKSSVLRAPLQIAKNCFKGKKIAKAKNVSSAEKQFNNVSIPKALWAVTLAFEKQIKLKRVWRARARGMIVICDRYPQTQFMGINDGPLLYSWIDNGNCIKRKLAKWELDIYLKANVLKPDLLIKMVVDSQTAKKRKPMEDPIMIEKKVKIIKEIKIPSSCTATIDAAKPLDEVIKDVYSKVSSIL